jgi:hypothetical protein
MRTRVRWGVTLLAALALFAGCVSVARAQPVETAASADARIRQLVDLHILLGAPDGDLQLDRQVNGGELVVLLERVLDQPESTPQSIGTPTTGGEANGWIRAYAWTRGVWNRVLYVRTQVRHFWFGLRYKPVEGSGWGVERSHWMFTSLRDAYLDDGLIDLSFQPKKRIGGSEGINMLLTAAGFGGEVAAIQAQTNVSVGDDAHRVVCRQHGLDSIMDYAGKPLTRREAALLAWQLLAKRTGSS